MAARLPPTLYLALGALLTLLLGLLLMPMPRDRATEPPVDDDGEPVVITVVVAFPTEPPTQEPTATRTPASTATVRPTRPTCLTPSPGDRCRNRAWPTAVPTLTPRPTEPWCEDLDLWVRKDQDCTWRPATPTPTPLVVPTSAPLPSMEE